MKYLGVLLLTPACGTSVVRPSRSQLSSEEPKEKSDVSGREKSIHEAGHDRNAIEKMKSGIQRETFKHQSDDLFNLHDTESDLIRALGGEVKQPSQHKERLNKTFFNAFRNKKNVIEKISKMFDESPENRPNINARNQRGQTALHIAVMEGNPRLIEFLITQGADLNAHDNSDSTPLLLAAKLGDIYTVDYFLWRCHAKPDGADNLGMTPLHWAIKNGHLRIAYKLILAGAKVDARDNNKVTPLHLAAENADVFSTHVLLSSGANPRSADINGNTPLHWLATHHKTDHIETARELLSSGANAFHMNFEGKNPLQSLFESKFKTFKPRLMELLKTQGAEE